MNKKKNNKGFSLIELIIAIAILVILTGLLAPQFMKYIEKSREAKDLQALDTVYSAIQGAFADETAYKDFADEDKTGGKYADISAGMSIEKIIAADGAFSNEVKTILGGNTKKFTLSSKKAGEDAIICVRIEYTPGTGESTDDKGALTPETYDGFEISVFSGKVDKDGKAIDINDGLGVVGATYDTIKK